jgi:predicted nucleic acid-binding protein
LVLAEVAGAVSRTRGKPKRAEAFAVSLSKLPNLTLVDVDASLAKKALVLAAHYGLRGADAVYAAVAVQADCTLVTLDNEQLTRLKGVIATETSATLLPKL